MLLLSCSAPINQRRYTEHAINPESESIPGEEKTSPSRFNKGSPSFWGIYLEGQRLSKQEDLVSFCAIVTHVCLVREWCRRNGGKSS